MNQKLDRDRVCIAAQTGLTAALIAERLGCSERQVHRILKARRITISQNPLIGTEDEPLLWDSYRRWNDSYRRIAYRFCLSHETIRQHFTQPRQIGEPV